MAEGQEVAFDNWEDEFQELEAKIQNEQPVTVEEHKATVEAEATQSETKSQTKPQAIDPHKAFINKLESYKMINEDRFDQYFETAREQSTNQELKASNQILKNQKDFSAFAKQVAKVFNNKTQQQDLDAIEDAHILAFFEENLLLIYNQLEWKSMEGVKDKLKVVKKEKKEEKQKAKKQKEREQRLKKTGASVGQKIESSNKIESKPEDDIFGGATLVNSKQLEDELKTKPVEKVEAPKHAEDDDDDFM